MMAVTKPVQISLPVDFLNRLDAVVTEMGTTRSALIREVLDPVLRDHQIKMMEKQEAEAYARQPQTEEEAAEQDAWRDVESWGPYETR